MYMALLSFATSYFTPGIYFYVLYATMNQIGTDPNLPYLQYIARVVSLFYIILYLIAIAGGLSGSVWTKYAENVSRVFAIFTYALLVLVTYNIIFVYIKVNNKSGINYTFSVISILIMIAVNLGGFILLIVLHLFTHPDKVGRLMLDTFSYWFYQGAYAQTMVAHAFCNVDDVSWGTKGSTNAHGGKTY